jgi:integrase/recombinase XerD
MRRFIRSERVKLPRVHRITRRGKVYKYHRRTRVELPNNIPEDHPEFIAAWTAEEAKKGPVATKSLQGTIAAACEAYLASGVYRELSDSYRPVIRRHVDAIKLRGGSAKLTDLRHYHINNNLDPLTPAVARSRLKAWRKLGAFWLERGMIPENVSRAATGKPMPKTDGHKEWTHSDVDAFRKYWKLDTQQRLAMEILQWTGVRCVDAIRLGPGMIDRTGILAFKQRKTGVDAFVPWLSPSLGMEGDREDLLALTADVKNMVFLVTNVGKPRSQKGFSQWFSAAATKAGLPNLTAHGLRKFRMNELAEKGASVLQMQAWIGHLSLSEIELYTRKAQRRAAFKGVEQEQNPVKHGHLTRKQ